MVRWLEHAMYQPSVRQLVWSQGKTSTPLWNQWARHESIFPCPNPAVGSARGQLIHNLPWGATPETMGLAWVDLVDGPCPAMSPYHTLPDKGHGLVMALNQVLRAAHTPDRRGTQDGCVEVRAVLGEADRATPHTLPACAPRHGDARGRSGYNPCSCVPFQLDAINVLVY